jgi:signal transduction histidine kinase
VFSDITKLKELEQQVLTNTIETEERERKRFAQELHDGLGPLLSAAKMYLQWISQTEDKQDIPNLLNKTHLLIDEAYNTSREISHNLSPHILENFGFAVALKNFIDRSKITDYISVKLCDRLKECDNCLKSIGTQKNTILYRAITECINNTIKHANASEINISMEHNEKELEIFYSDNGEGFDFKNGSNTNKGLGIFNMKNRIEAINGKFDLNSIPGKGTTVKIKLDI